MAFIALHYPKDKKFKNKSNREVFINVDKIRYFYSKNLTVGESQTEIWFDSKDCIIVAETLDEIKSLINQNLHDKNSDANIKFQDVFDKKEYEDFIKREG